MCGCLRYSRQVEWVPRYQRNIDYILKLFLCTKLMLDINKFCLYTIFQVPLLLGSTCLEQLVPENYQYTHI